MSEANPNCPVCTSGIGPDVNMTYANTGSKDEVYRAFNFSRQAIRDHLSKCLHLAKSGGSSEISIDDIERPLTSDDEVLSLMGMSSDVYEIAPNSLNVSARTLASGDMLYSYRAKVNKIEKAVAAASESFDIQGWRSRLQNEKPILPKVHDEGSTYVMAIADPQLGKKGTQEAIENWERGVRGHVARIKRMLMSGVPIEKIWCAWQGDETEGVCNNYLNQPYTVEMNLSTQLETDFDLRLWTLKVIRDEIDEVAITGSSVISNHGEFTRNGSKDPVTSRGDNSSTMVMRMVARTMEDRPGYKDIDFVIGEGEPAVFGYLSGVKTYFSHGYIEKGSGAGPEARQYNAMTKQILADPLGMGDVRLYVLAHYHHQWMKQDRNFTIMGLPALEAEGSSEYMRDQYGVWSKPGMAGFLVGKHFPLGWSEFTVI